MLRRGLARVRRRPHATLPERSPLTAPGSAVTRYYSCTGEGQVGIAAIGGGNTGTRALFAAEASSDGCDHCLVGTWQQQVERGPDEGFVTLFEPWGAVALISGGYRFTPDERVADAMTMTVTYDHPGPHLEMRPDGRFLYSDPRLVVFEGESDEGWARHTTYFAVDGIAVEAVRSGPLLALERTLPDGSARVEYFDRLP